MRKIVDYLVVRNEQLRELQVLVNENIKDWNWQPLGGINAVAYQEAMTVHVEYTQALVKYEEIDWDTPLKATSRMMLGG